MRVPKKAKSEMSDKPMTQQLKQMASVFLSHRQMGEAEAVYRVTPDMHLSESNIKCVYVQTGFPASRYVHANKVSNDVHDPRFAENDSVFEIADRIGLYKESATLLYYYERRDIKDNVDKLCYAQFCKEYETCRKKKPDSTEKLDATDDSEENEEEVEDRNDEEISDIPTKDRIWTGNPDEVYKLPNIIKLTNVNSDDATYMKRRSFPNAIRFHKIKDRSSHEWIYS